MFEHFTHIHERFADHGDDHGFDLIDESGYMEADQRRPHRSKEF